MDVVIIGTGNVATQLGLALKQAGHKIVTVVGRNTIRAKGLAQILRTGSTGSFNNIPKSDFILIAVSDHSIELISKKIPASVSSVVMHTSGSVAIDVLKKRFKKCGVFYPVQTISVNDYLDFRNVPVCIEGYDKPTEKKIKQLASGISDNVVKLSSVKRKTLHLAAVITNNFSNHLFVLANEILKKNKIPFNLLLPLIEQTAHKISIASPVTAQTGPAKRGDKKVIKEHLRMLNNQKKLKEIYKLMSDSIASKR